MQCSFNNQLSGTDVYHSGSSILSNRHRNTRVSSLSFIMKIFENDDTKICEAIEDKVRRGACGYKSNAMSVCMG